MVTYYNSNTMYRHQQAMAAPNSAVHSWYAAAGYHHQPQMPSSSYCMQDEQQMWHHPGATHPHFHNEFNDFMHAGMAHQGMHHQALESVHNQLPSPPITVSGSEMSSPGGSGAGNLSPPNAPQVSRPPTVRSPFEWIKKTSYQTTPNPGKTRTKDKYRVVYTDHQKLELEKEFTFVNKYITIRRKTELATNLGLSERQIKIWFQNRRAKERKVTKKRIEERSQFDLNQLFQQNLVLNQQTQQHPQPCASSSSPSQSNLIIGIPAPSSFFQRQHNFFNGVMKSEVDDMAMAN